MNLIESDIHANGTRLHIYRTESEKPPLVFAHGIADSGLCFVPIAEQLADDFEIILYDSRGHGQSDAPDPASTVERAHDLAGLVTALRLDKPFLLGHSMGAVSVALCAGLDPNLPGKIVLEDPPSFERLAANSAADIAARNTWRGFAAADKARSIEELVEKNRRESPTWPEAERLPWARAKRQFSMTVFDEPFIGAETGNRILQQITCPALILTADADKGAMFPPAAADALAASMPNVRHANIPGAGHSIRREQPAAYVKAVRGFLSGNV